MIIIRLAAIPPFQICFVLFARRRVPEHREEKMAGAMGAIEFVERGLS